MYKTNALLDTRAVESAMSETELRKKATAHPNALIQEMPAPHFKVQIAYRNLVKVTRQVLLRFFPARRRFEETFLILPTMRMVLLGISFSENHSVTIDVKKSFSTASGHFNAST